MKEVLFHERIGLQILRRAAAVSQRGNGGETVGHLPVQRIRTDARKGLSSFENRITVGCAERKVPRMGGTEHGRKRMRKFYRYPTRDAVKNYFPLPNEIFMLDLSAGEIAVYAYLDALGGVEANDIIVNSDHSNIEATDIDNSFLIVLLICFYFFLF